MKTNITLLLFAIGLLFTGCQKCYRCGQETYKVYFENGTDSVSVRVYGDTANSIECYHMRELGYTQYDFLSLGAPDILECDEKRMEYQVYLGYRCIADN